MGQLYSLLWDACGFWSLTNCGCGLQKKKKKRLHPTWVFLRKMPEKQSILFACISTWIYLFLEMYLVIGLANLGQYMKFGLILGGMNRSGLCVRV